MLNLPNQDANVSQETGLTGLIDVIVTIFIIQFLFSALGGGDGIFGGGSGNGIFGGMFSTSSEE